MAVRYSPLAVILATSALLLAACESSGNVHPPPTPTQPPGLTATATVGSAGTSALLAGGGTTTTTFAFPGATAGVGSTLTLTASTQAPVAGASLRRAPQSIKSILEYVTVESSAAVTFTGTPALTFVLPAADVNAAGTYTLELYNSTAPGTGFVTLSTGTLNGSTLTFPAGTTPFSIPVAPAFVVFALALTVPGPSPTPTATPTGTPTPSASPSATPTPGTNIVSASTPYLTFAGPSASPQPVTITEQNGAALTETDTCTTGSVTIVAVTPGGTTTPAQNTISVTVTPEAVGTCAFTYKDAAGNSATVGVTVSNPAPIVIQ